MVFLSDGSSPGLVTESDFSNQWASETEVDTYWAVRTVKM